MKRNHTENICKIYTNTFEENKLLFFWEKDMNFFTAEDWSYKNIHFKHTVKFRPDVNCVMKKQNV